MYIYICIYMYICIYIYDVIFDHAYYKSFYESLESLQHKRWFGKLYTFYKIFKNQLMCYYLFNQMSYYLFKPLLITQDRIEIYPFFILNAISSKTLFSSVIIE